MPGSRNRWEEFAASDSHFYICTDKRFRGVEDAERFFESGREDAAAILAMSAPLLAGTHRALEIGCGVGRLALTMSEHFDEVIAVDVAPTMLERLRANCRRASIDNVRPYLAEEAWDEAGPVDLAYSYLVFQHVEEWDSILGYLRRVAACLSPTGTCVFQFDTRRPSLSYGVRNRLPDALLPGTQRRGIRRVRRSAAEVRAAVLDANLTILAEQGVQSDAHVLVLGAPGR